jgi:hypothetical protein
MNPTPQNAPSQEAAVIPTLILRTAAVDALEALGEEVLALHGTARGEEA